LENTSEQKADYDARSKSQKACCRSAEAIPMKDRVLQPITKYHEIHYT
jgi:hypothetical protein